MNQNLVSIVVLALSLVSSLGCGVGVTPEAEFDSLVEDVWLDLNESQLVDAVEYLESGGRHYDVSSVTTVDRDYTLPLCRKLNELEDVTVQALIFNDDSISFATELLIELPASSVTRSEIESRITAQDKAFRGRINQEWGNKWLAIEIALTE